MKEAPADIEAEQRLIGAVFVDNEQYHYARVETEDFYEMIHRQIWSAISNLIAAGKQAHPGTVKVLVDADDIMGDMTVAQYLVMLSTEALAVDAAECARSIKGMALRRRLLSVADTLEAAAFDLSNDIATKDRPALDDIVDEVQSSIDVARGEMFGEDTETLSDTYWESITATEETRGIPVPIDEMRTALDATHLRPGRAYGLLGSSGEGKTSLTLQLAYWAVRKGHPVVFLSFDQGRAESVSQVIAQQLGISAKLQARGDLTDDEKERCYNFALDLQGMPFEFWSSDKRLTMTAISSAVRRMLTRTRRKMEKAGKPWKTPLICLDHIRAVLPENPGDDHGSRALQIGMDFKSLCKQHDAVGWMLFQRSSSSTKRDNPRPIPQDIFGGEGTMAPFDAIMYVFRPLRYRDQQLATAFTKKKKDEISEEWPWHEWDGKAELGTVKNRWGASVRRKVRWDEEYTRYRSTDLAYNQERMDV